MKLFVLAMIGSLCLVVVRSHRWFRPTSITEGSECFPEYPAICGNVDLLSTDTTEVTEGDVPNVCNTTKTYSYTTFSYVEVEYCYSGGFCIKSCGISSHNCTGPEHNFTRSHRACCEGFGIDPEDKESVKDSLKRKHYHFLQEKVLEEKGCNLELEDSVSDCLVDLGLTQFVNELVNFPDISDRLGKVDAESDDKFTLFLPNITDLVDFTLESHIVNSEVLGKKLNDFLVLDTLTNTSIHFGEADKSLFANGVKITTTNACRARNGVVHIVEAPIPQSSDTISDIINPESKFSTFGQLLNATSISDLLDVGNGKSRTVLAPTNAAFDALPEGTLECLLLDENRDYLHTLVLIHIGLPADYSVTLSQRSRFYTFTYYYLFVSVEEDDTILVTRDKIPLVEVDITASNGVIHGISEVIFPPKSPCDSLENGAS